MSGVFILDDSTPEIGSKVYLKLVLPNEFNSEEVKIIGTIDDTGVDPRLQESGLRVSFQNISGAGEVALYEYLKSRIPKAPSGDEADSKSKKTLNDLDSFLDEDSRRFFEVAMNEGEAFEDTNPIIADMGSASESTDSTGDESIVINIAERLKMEAEENFLKVVVGGGALVIGAIYFISKIAKFFMLFVGE